MSTKRKTYKHSSVQLEDWVKGKVTQLPNPTTLMLEKLARAEIEPCTYKTYCFHTNSLRRILVNGEASFDALLEKTGEDIIKTVEGALDSSSSGYYRKLMTFLKMYLKLCDHPGLQEINLTLREHCFQLEQAFILQQNKNVRNAKEFDNWVSFHKLQEVCERMIKDAADSVAAIDFDDQPQTCNGQYLKKVEIRRCRIKYQEALMVSLYVLIPPCRNDLLDIKYCLYDKENDNYYEKNEEGQGQIVLNHYKTCKRYGSCTMTLPPRMTNLLSDFIETFHPASPYIFYNRRGGIYKESAFSHHLTDILLRETGKPVTIQMLRKIYATQTDFQSIEKTNEIARRMGHSVKMHYQYKKNNSNNNNDDDGQTRTFQFQQISRTMYDEKLDGSSFFLWRRQLLAANPTLEVDYMRNVLKALMNNFDGKIVIDDYDETNEIQKEFMQELKKDCLFKG
jgi:hypothetical protein